ncbi:hemolysin family protein [Falcatimonas sp. MSJ-15]|uniref:HlyC/CorC family transporter n=1 Tax=Falcatimonas sp. MSJ-15 TaxID=2841515 RepID=UPI001C11A36E|nr:hemolysin family protein [Falcatimonas sp. MSJ-15]MBU5468776.1 hemolysin family protein [Falcatimonas sp. MSJ-15]
MDSTDVMQLVIVVILIGLSAFFSSAETAFTTVSKIRIRSLCEEGNKRAMKVNKVIEDSGKMLSAILIGNNIVNIGASSLATTLAINIWGSYATGIVTGVLTLIILIFGEITPKTLATIHAEKIALTYSNIIYGLMWVLTPVIFVVNKLSLGVLTIFRVDPSKKTSTITETELRTIVDVGHEEGVIESDERKMINNVFDFGDSLAKDIMVPRIDMVCISKDDSYEEILSVFKKEKYTRIPVYEDSQDNVIGILNVKDLLLSDNTSEFNVADIMREPYFTYEYKKTSELLDEMKKTSNNISIVLDEYGATAGLITLEDILEEIVGEIRDEYDSDEEDSIRRIKDNEYLIDGIMKLDDINEALDTELESEDYDSLGGLVIEMLDHLPVKGESVEYKNYRFVVEKLDKNRIDKVHMYILEKKEEDGDED